MRLYKIILLLFELFFENHEEKQRIKKKKTSVTSPQILFIGKFKILP